MARTKLFATDTSKDVPFPPAAGEVAAPKAAPTYAPGDVCYLKCGSCRMVVEKVYLDGVVACVWQHYDSKEILRGQFDSVTLSKA